jgi:YtkA-like
MSRPIRFVAGAAALAVAGPVFACGESLRGERRTIENSRYAIASVTSPAAVEVGRHFVVDFAVCPRAGAPAPQDVRVDANMPEHRHGMNYRASVARSPAGTYRADGMLFHMPGRWDITFDVVAGNRTDRLTGTMRVE